MLVSVCAEYEGRHCALLVPASAYIVITKQVLYQFVMNVAYTVRREGGEEVGYERGDQGGGMGRDG